MTSFSKVLFALLLAVAVSVGVLFGQAQRKAPIPYPTGYRSWTLVKSMVIFSNQHPLFSKFGGLHNIFVNDTGLRSMVQGKAYPDGSVLVFDLYDIRTVQGAIEARDRKFLAVMRKSSKLYADTGGWAFELFRGYEEKGSLQNPKQQCFECHAPQKRTDYVQSAYTP